MPKVILYNQKGEKKGDLEVSKKIFGAEYNEGLVHQALLRQLSNARPGVFAHTKTKADVKGGGAKPFRQKGTGRARQGSTRNPHYIGGGVAHGPRNNRNYEKDMPRKQRRLALYCALSAKMNENKIMALDTYDDKESKTKNLQVMLQNLPIEKDVLIVVAEKNESLAKAGNNLPFVKTLLVNYLNIADLQKYDNVLFLEEALNKVEEIFKLETNKTK
ncbi:50S ribosomal protein L4 [Candidatus Peregrinibacteria bacterium]|nr:50S ribosomal protein L4 [Candidatus Peregrinibacteria bacterium]